MTAAIVTPTTPLSTYPMTPSTLEQAPHPQGKTIENAVLAYCLAQFIIIGIGAAIRERQNASVNHLSKNSEDIQNMYHRQAAWLAVGCGVSALLTLAGAAIPVPEPVANAANANPRLGANAGLSDGIAAVGQKLKDPKFLKAICNGGATVTDQMGKVSSLIYKSQEVELEMNGKIQERVTLAAEQTTAQGLDQYMHSIESAGNNLLQLLQKDH